MFKNKYKGTYPSDQVPKNNGYMIVNLDSYGQPGSHWISLVRTPENIYIYDSFGRDPLKILPHYIFKDRHICYVDDDAEQEILETDCGVRSLAWLWVFDNIGSKYAKLI